MICMGIETVPGCGQEKSLDNFYEVPKGSGKYRKTCKSCIARSRKIEKEKIKILKIKADSLDELDTKVSEKKELNNFFLIEKLREAEDIIKKLTNNYEDLNIKIKEKELYIKELETENYNLKIKLKTKKN